MARSSGKAARSFRMAQLGEPGPRFRPEQDYFSVSLLALNMPGGFLNMSRFAPVIWSALQYASLEGEKTLVGLYPDAQSQSPDFARKDRIDIRDLQLTPRLVAREEITVSFTLGAIKEKDFVAGALDVVRELASTPAAAFLSQAVPAIGMLGGAVQTAERILQSFQKLRDEDKLRALGAFKSTLRPPIMSGIVAFVDEREDAKGLRFDEARNQLMRGTNPVRSAYAVLRLNCEPSRPDWMLLPDLNQAWLRIREAALSGGDIAGAINYFRIAALTSPDLTHPDARRLVEAAQNKFAPVLDGAESSVSGDPGDLAEALSFFLAPEGDGAESMTLQIGGARAAVGAVTSAPFNRAFDIVLEHEGGYVDHPNDPGGATNRGVTQRTYDDFRSRKGLPRQSVRDLEIEECRELYFHGYWRPARCPELPNDALALVTFDAAVNHGPRQAIKLLQQASGVPEGSCDGVWGPTTRARVISAAANAKSHVETFLLRRERFYRRIVEVNPKLGAFLRGWMNRIVVLRSQAQALLTRAPGGGDTESALYQDDDQRVPLVAADADFSVWESDVATPPSRAAL